MQTISLAAALTSFFGADQDLAQSIALRFEPHLLAKNEVIQRQGEKVSKLLFIESGLLRIYAETETKEVTQWISTPGYFLTDLASFFNNEPARWTIESLVPTKIWAIGKESYFKLPYEFPIWPALERQFLVKCFAIMENRIFQHLHLTAQERYNQFHAYFPELFNEVPLQYLASMLGMSAETLSRIRGKRD